MYATDTNQNIKFKPEYENRHEEDRNAVNSFSETDSFPNLSFYNEENKNDDKKPKPEFENRHEQSRKLENSYTGNNSYQQLLLKAVEEKHEKKILIILETRERAYETYKKFGEYPREFGNQIRELMERPEFLLDLDYHYENGKTLFMIAAENDMFDVMYSLQKQGANLRAQDINGKTVIQYAKDNKSLNELIAAKSRDNTKDTINHSNRFFAHDNQIVPLKDKSSVTLSLITTDKNTKNSDLRIEKTSFNQ